MTAQRKAINEFLLPLPTLARPPGWIPVPLPSWSKHLVTVLAGKGNAL